MTTLKANPTTQQQRMGFNPNRRDPIPLTDRELLSADTTKINNRSGSINSDESFCIVKSYETEKKKQERENEAEGLGAHTDTEVYIMMECSFDEYDSWESYNWDDEPIILHDPYLVQYGDDPNEFYMDDGASCSFPNGGAGASFAEEEQTAEAPQLTPEQEAFLAANAEPQGALTTAFDAAANPAPEEENPAPAFAANNPSFAPAPMRA